MKIEVLPVREDQKSVLRQLMELYNYDFSEYTGDEINEYGYYNYLHFDHYWTDESRHPFFVKVNNNLAGFVMVFSLCDYISSNNAHSIAEFFIMRKYRRNRIGNYIARYIFDLFKGEWEVKILHVNEPAKQFWYKVISEYTNDNFKLHEEIIEDWDGFGYTFKTPDIEKMNICGGIN